MSKRELREWIENYLDDVTCTDYSKKEVDTLLRFIYHGPSVKIKDT